jgi:protocatechuate 3,4-dioxygenase beta subunit
MHLTATSSTRWRAFRALIGATVLVLPVLCPAQNAVQQKSAGPAPGSCRIAGRVVNASTGEPVRRATVAALGEDDGQVVQSTQTDAEGRFALEHLPPGKYPLTASRRGFRMSFFDEHDEFNSAIVTGPDQDTSHLEFRLMPGAVLHGVVTGDGGDPAENASVILFRLGHGSEHRESADAIHETDGTMTDDTGAYEFTNLSPGKYYLAVITSPWYALHAPVRRAGTNEDSPLDVAYPVTFFDSTTDEASATPIELEAGSRQEADISLHAVPALRLLVAAPRKGSGIIQPELRTLVFGTQVSAEGGGAGDPIHTGVVEFSGIAPGRYELAQGDPPRISELDAGSSGVVDPNAGSPAVTVSGILRSATGAPVPENVAVQLDPANGQRNQTSMQINARKGEFRFDAVPSGTWSVSAAAQGNALPVVAVAAAGSVTPGNQLTVKDRSLSIVATVSSSLSRVQGFARVESKGVAGAMIVLVPRQPSAYRALVRRDQSDSDGSFSLRDVPPGRYTVIAIQNGWKLDWTDRELMARYLSGGVGVTVSDQAGGAVRLSDAVPVQ